MNELIFGKDTTLRVVSVEPGAGDKCNLFIQSEDGSIETKQVPMAHWILYTQQHSPKMRALAGDQPYKWLVEYDSREKFDQVLRQSGKQKLETYPVAYWDGRCSIPAKEAFMLKSGVTYYKGLKVKDVSILSFDLEHTFGIGENPDPNGKLLLISNTFRDFHGKIVKNLFSFDEYTSEGALLVAWCEWLRKIDPSILTGHNIFGHDFKILRYAFQRAGVSFAIGRQKKVVNFENNKSKFRKDGSQAYDYHNAHIYGREIVDTFFLAIKYDVARNYESYGLKAIIKHEGLEKKDRVHYDASQIIANHTDPVEWAKIKAYAIDDADDALAIYDLMIAPFFYATQSIPRTLQQNINSATGSQINGIMVRGYLQQGHSIARADDAVPFEGAISFGVPGIHRNVLRFDVASLYPSVMRQYRIFNKAKDPKELFLKMVDYFTVERLANKKRGKETGDRYYKDLEQSQKITINSMYGFLGMNRASYNYPEGAALVTKYGREILQKSILWASGKYYEPTNDTEAEDEVA